MFPRCSIIVRIYYNPRFINFDGGNKAIYNEDMVQQVQSVYTKLSDYIGIRKPVYCKETLSDGENK